VELLMQNVETASVYLKRSNVKAILINILVESFVVTVWLGVVDAYKKYG
jgi:hypothetical protein